MKKIFYYFFTLMIALSITNISAIAAPVVTLTTPAITAANINQGSTANVVYAVKMSVATTAVTINNIQFTLLGTHDNNDLTVAYLYYNVSAPVVSGASYLGSATTTFSAPHTYSVNVNKPMAVGEQGYYFIVVNVDPSGTDNHTIKVNGSTNPMVFGYSVASAVTNNQSDKAGIQTIQAADITLNTYTSPAVNINQGSTGNVVYSSKMKVLTEPTTVSNIQFTLLGTHDNNDLAVAYLYYNASAPVVSGASYLGSATTTFSAPHTYSVNVNKPMAVGEQGYYFIVVNVDPSGSDNKTVKVNGDTDPMVFGFSTSPNITNNQSNNAGASTIQAADITLNTYTSPAVNINQGSTGNVVYSSKMKVLTEPTTVSNIQFTLLGTHDNNDLAVAYLYYNASAPVVSGASYLGSATTTFSAPHTYSVNVNKPMAVGEQGYYFIVVNVDPSGSDNKTVKVNGDTDPMVFGFSTSPNITNNQSNNAGASTIQAADITLNTYTSPAVNINQGSTGNVVYSSKMKVLTEPTTVSNIQFTLLGTHDNNDLAVAYLYYNASAPVVSGASYLGSATTTFSAPHTYSVNVNKPMAVGEQGYYFIVVNVNPSGSDNKTVKVNGDTDPMVFGFSTSPNITNNQSNNAGASTIQAADITLTSSSIPSGNIALGSTSNVVYTSKMKVLTEPTTVSNIQFTLLGTHDNNDLAVAYLYYNASAPVVSGASYLGSATTTFSAPHTYSVNVNKPMAVGEQGYYFVTVNVSATASVGKTVKMNGATDPMIFGFSTTPNITNSQSNASGTKTISATGKPIAVADESLINDKNAFTIKNIFPNPANASFSFSVAGVKDGNITAQLTNRSGNILLQKSLSINKGMNQYSMNVSSVMSGVYYLVIMNDRNVLISKQQIIVQH